MILPQARPIAHDRLDASVNIGQVDLLVWRVEVVVGQAKARQDRGDVQQIRKEAHDRDAAAAARKDSIGAKDLAHGGGRFTNKGIGWVDAAGLGRMQDAQRRDRPRGRGGGDGIAEEAADAVGILAWGEATAQLNQGLAGDDGLGTIGGESASDAVELQRGTAPGSLDDAVAGLAG